MKTFPHWRAVGRAMRWARQQEGVTTWRVRGRHCTERDWTREDSSVVVTAFRTGVFIDVTHNGRWKPADNTDAATVLRVLAALDLVPAYLADGEDERYGRCVTCGRVARWWSAEAGAEGRWVHQITNDERFINFPAHLAEVADV